MGGFVVAVPLRRRLDAAEVSRTVDICGQRTPGGTAHVVTAKGTLLVQCHAPIDDAPSDRPESDPNGMVWVVKRGHLTNLTEARASVIKAGVQPTLLGTTAGVILGAYLAWGGGFAGRLEGEFTAAIWDERVGRLVVLRDHLGLAPCFVHAGGEVAAAASEPSQLLVLPGVSKELDQHTLADWVSGAPVDRLHTLYASIKRPLPASINVYDRAARSTNSRCYWLPRTNHSTSAPDMLSAAEQTRSAVDDAVRRSLGAQTRAICELSGGLDSTAVLGSALHAGTAELLAFSRRYPGMGSDEGQYIEAALRKHPVEHLTVDASVADYDDEKRHLLGRSLSYPVGLVHRGSTESAQWAATRGARLWLGGDGGDELFLSAGVALTHATKPARSWPAFAWWNSGRSARQLVTMLRRDLLRPVVPDAVLSAYLAWKRTPRDEDSKLVSPRAWALQQELSEENRLDDPSSELDADGFWNPGTLTGRDFTDAIQMRDGLERRTPLLSRELIDLMADIPLRAHIWKGGWRTLQKRALADYYPTEVRFRMGKADLTQPVAATLIPTEFYGRSVLAELGLADGVTAQRHAVQAAHAARQSRDFPSPWQAMAIVELDEWLSTVT